MILSPLGFAHKMPPRIVIVSKVLLTHVFRSRKEGADEESYQSSSCGVGLCVNCNLRMRRSGRLGASCVKW